MAFSVKFVGILTENTCFDPFFSPIQPRDFPQSNIAKGRTFPHYPQSYPQKKPCKPLFLPLFVGKPPVWLKVIHNLDGGKLHFRKFSTIVNKWAIYVIFLKYLYAPSAVRLQDVRHVRPCIALCTVHFIPPILCNVHFVPPN